jgi:hypothetical protein
VYQNSSLRSTLAWKWLPGFLYQIEDEGKRGRQQRDRKREGVIYRVLQGEKDSAGNKNRQIEKTCGANVRLMSKMIKNVANDIVPMICIFSLLIYK